MNSREPGVTNSARPGLLEAMGATWSMLAVKDRRRLLGLVGLLVIGAGLEALGVGSILPIVLMITRGESAAAPGLSPKLYAVLERLTSGVGPPAVALLVVGVFVVKNGFLSLTAYLQFRFINRLQVEAGEELFRLYMSLPYVDHLGSNPAHLLRDIDSDVKLAHQKVLRAMIQLLTEAFVLSAITLLLALLDPAVAIAAFGVCGAMGWAFHRLIRRKSAGLGLAERRARGRINELVLQGLHSLRETKVLGREGFFIAGFAEEARLFSRAHLFNQMATTTPYYVLETVVAASLLLVLWLGLVRGYELSTLAPVLAVFVVAALRLAPSLNRTLGAVESMRFHGPSVRALLANRSRARASILVEVTMGERIELTNSIQLRGVSFSYPDSRRRALTEVELTIPHGTIFGLVGPTGSGKTTTADLVLGLLRPQSGEILVDGKDIFRGLESWRDQVAYVPQTVYLTDDTIRRNVAFALPPERIDEAAVLRALEGARLLDFVRSLPKGLETVVGEAGARLSAGERQRIGIARALYRPGRLLVLDESTSALDLETERQICETISSLRKDRTILIIAHRPSTIESCDQVCLLSEGRIMRIGAPREVMGEGFGVASAGALS
ncbi:MAG: ABC transporter ATP-binding protein [Deltaproteobacteria bacterium]|nr:ABC transporter ATP-binding protein [Deltaproteobacteria bacterium]